MKMAEELQRELRSINRKSYPAYKGLKGCLLYTSLFFPDLRLLCIAIFTLEPQSDRRRAEGQDAAQR